MKPDKPIRIGGIEVIPTDDLAALRAKNERLKKEAGHRESDRKRWLKATAEDKARIAELEGALKPFEVDGLYLQDGRLDSEGWTIRVTVGDLRRAAAALKGDADGKDV